MDEFQEYESGLPHTPDVQTTIEVLRASQGGTISKTLYYGMAAFTDADRDTLASVWGDLAPSYRRKLVRALAETSETNPELDYRIVAEVALTDPDPGVREGVIDLRWDDERSEWLDTLIELAEHDEAREVRAAAASALGSFILLGEYEDVPASVARSAYEAARRILHNEDEDLDVRRRALEAVANSSAEGVLNMIRSAYQHSDRRMQVSAVYAMGASADNVWDEYVLREMLSEDPEMRYEAARSAGALGIEDALPVLGKLVHDEDIDVRDAAIWSLGEIGGNEAVRILQGVMLEAEESGDEDLMQAVDESLENASFGDNSLYMMRFDDE
jgi:HEAT repeat protein